MKRRGSKDPVHGELEAIHRELRNIRKELQRLSKTLNQSTNALGPHRRAKSTSRLAKDKKVRSLVIKLLREGCSYTEIVEQLRTRLNFSTSRAAVGRFARSFILEQLPESKLW